ncbi:MAG: hypothetical protein KGZ90_05075 [Algoriphagus sp.]|nr:hypothetical protein [Algoriphagus sp.]
MTQKTLIAIDPEALQGIEQKLDQILSMRPQKQSDDLVEWITNKKFMEQVSIRAYNTFARIRDKMPDSLKREINGKQYIHREAVQRYFQGDFSS